MLICPYLNWLQLTFWSLVLAAMLFIFKQWFELLVVKLHFPMKDSLTDLSQTVDDTLHDCHYKYKFISYSL